MKDSAYDELLRLSLKRELTVEDQARIEACLAAHPEWREQWRDDAALSRALRSVPDVPLASNFTNRVLEGIDLEERAAGRERSRRPARRWFRFLPARLGWALLAVLLAGAGAWRYNNQQTLKVAQDVRVISQDIAAVPAPDVFKDFDTINQLRYVSTVSDDELLNVLR